MSISIYESDTDTELKEKVLEVVVDMLNVAHYEADNINKVSRVLYTMMSDIRDGLREENDDG